MSEYTRPEIAPRVFRDADGEVIDYGNRWGMGLPPDDTYSVTSNLERFEPLHAVADALIAWLADTYDVTVAEDHDAVADSIAARMPASRAVRLTPAEASAAPMVFVFTDFPGVVVHVGAAHRVNVPPCGCDACDENWEQGAEELEFTVRAVVSGGFTERIRGRFRLTVFHSLELPGVASTGSEGSWLATNRDRDQLKAARAQLRAVGPWRPWSLRAGDA